MSTERFSGAEWFNKNQSITVVGCGAIGHTLTTMLAVYGHNVTVYDGDDVGEENVFVQGFTSGQVGMKKVDALTDNYLEMIDPFNNNNPITAIDQFWNPGDYLDDIVIMAVDKIDVRKQIFEQLQEKDNFMFIDARVGAEYFQVYHVTKDYIDEYAKTLFDESEAAPINCTYKMTRHAALMCQGYIISALNQYIVNKDAGFEIMPHVFYRELNAKTL